MVIFITKWLMVIMKIKEKYYKVYLKYLFIYVWYNSEKWLWCVPKSKTMKSRNLHHSMTLLAIHEGHFPYLEQQQCMWKDCNSLSPLHSNKATYNSCMGSEVGKLLKYLRNGITMNSSSFTLYNSAKLGCQENDSRFHATVQMITFWKRNIIQMITESSPYKQK